MITPDYDNFCEVSIYCRTQNRQNDQEMSFWGSDIWAETPRWESVSALHRWKNNIPSSRYTTQASLLISLSCSSPEKWGYYSIYLIEELGKWVILCQVHKTLP